jgi:hypothetical protein
MAFHVVLFLLVFLLFLGLALLWRLSWPYLQLSHAQADRRCALVHRLLKPRTPRDCPVCLLASSGVEPASAPVRPWYEVKSHRGAPKRIPTAGFACPNQQCAYFGITDAHIHALVGDGKHGQAEHIQTFRCQACHTTFTARRHTPLYRLKTPSHQVAMVLTALAEGLDSSAAERVFGYHQATITTWLTRAGEHAQILHERSFRNLHIPHLQLDELRTRLRKATQILWLWLAIDPLTKMIPVLELGPRTQKTAHVLIHSLRQSLAPGCLPLFTSDGLNLYFYATRGPFWILAPSASPRAQSPPVAGGDGLDLRPGEKMLPATQAHACHARDAPWDRGRSQNRLTGIGLLWEIEHRFHRAGETDHPPCNSGTGSSYVGDGATVLMPARPLYCFPSSSPLFPLIVSRASKLLGGCLSHLVTMMGNQVMMRGNHTPIWSGGAPTITLCVLTNHCKWRSCSHENEGANDWRNAIDNVRQPWQREEPTDDGRL